MLCGRNSSNPTADIPTALSRTRQNSSRRSSLISCHLPNNINKVAHFSCSTAVIDKHPSVGHSNRSHFFGQCKYPRKIPPRLSLRRRQAKDLDISDRGKSSKPCENRHEAKELKTFITLFGHCADVHRAFVGQRT